MTDEALWFAIYMTWTSSALVAWIIYFKAAWQGWLGMGGGTSRFAIDMARFMRWMLGGALGRHLYEPGQKLRFGITLTLTSTLIIGSFYWQLDRSAWSPFDIAVNAVVVGLSYIGIMVHLYVAWRDRHDWWRSLVWAQVALFLALWAAYPHLHIGAHL